MYSICMSSRYTHIHMCVTCVRWSTRVVDQMLQYARHMYNFEIYSYQYVCHMYVIWVRDIFTTHMYVICIISWHILMYELVTPIMCVCDTFMCVRFHIHMTAIVTRSHSWIREKFSVWVRDIFICMSSRNVHMFAIASSWHIHVLAIVYALMTHSNVSHSNVWVRDIFTREYVCDAFIVKECVAYV